MNTLKLLTLFVAGLLLGYFLVLFLPAIFATWLQDWWIQITGTPHRCDVGTDIEKRLEQTPAEAVDEIAGILLEAQEKSNRNVLEDAPIPKCFETWWIEQSKKVNK